MASPDLTATAVVLERPHSLSLAPLALTEPGDGDVVVEIEFSGISTGTERLLWSGRMPSFPGMGYPLVPGYESVGVISHAGPAAGFRAGDRVFVPGANCYRDARGLFGGASQRVVAPGARIMPAPADLGDRAVLLALAATAHHAIHCGRGAQATVPDLIVGHGILGRLLARLTVLKGAPAPTVWETTAARRAGAVDYAVVDPSDDPRRDYKAIFDCSGDSGLLDTLIARLAFGGEIVLAGFYSAPLSFTFPPAFMREAAIRTAAQWKPDDLTAVTALASSGRLSLEGLITHHAAAADAPAAYETAFNNVDCLKMVLDWRRHS